MSAGPPRASGRTIPATAPEPSAGVPFLTILLDVSANLLCVVVLLLTVSAASQSRRLPPAEVGFPVRSGEVLAPAGLIEAFRLRTVRETAVVSVDLRRDHVEVKPAGAPPAETRRLSFAEPDFAADLRDLLAPASGGVLLFVFAQDGYETLRPPLDALALPVTEVDVPLALRAPGADGGWSDAYRALFGRAVDPAAFPDRLARIIAGEGGTNGTAPGVDPPVGGTAGLAATLWSVLQAAGRLCLLALSVGAVVLVGRIRPETPGRGV